VLPDSIKLGLVSAHGSCLDISFNAEHLTASVPPSAGRFHLLLAIACSCDAVRRVCGGSGCVPGNLGRWGGVILHAARLAHLFSYPMSCADRRAGVYIGMARAGSESVARSAHIHWCSSSMLRSDSLCVAAGVTAVSDCAGAGMTVRQPAHQYTS
jgi:hypothetical protein